MSRSMLSMASSTMPLGMSISQVATAFSTTSFSKAVSARSSLRLIRLAFTSALYSSSVSKPISLANSSSSAGTSFSRMPFTCTWNTTGLPARDFS